MSFTRKIDPVKQETVIAALTASHTKAPVQCIDQDYYTYYYQLLEVPLLSRCQ